MRTSKGFDQREEKPIKGMIYEANSCVCEKCGGDVPDDLLVCNCGVEILDSPPRKRVRKLSPSELPQLEFGGNPIRIR